MKHKEAEFVTSDASKKYGVGYVKDIWHDMNVTDLLNVIQRGFKKEPNNPTVVKDSLKPVRLDLFIEHLNQFFKAFYYKVYGVSENESHADDVVINNCKDYCSYLTGLVEEVKNNLKCSNPVPYADKRWKLSCWCQHCLRTKPADSSNDEMPLR